MTIVTHWDQMYMCVFANDHALRLLLLKNSTTWSETYFRQDLFPAYLFFRRQFHAIVIFRFKSISDLDWIPPQIFCWIYRQKIKNRGVVTTTECEMDRNTLTSG